MPKLLLTFLATAALSPAGGPDVVSKQLESVEAIFRPISAASMPGAAVAVIRDGKVLLEKSYGMADVEKSKPITPSTIFRLASVTKSFTATAVLQLMEAGKLKLDDPLSRFLPDFPNGSRIHISHLLSHTAGIPDFIPMDEVRKRPLEFEPGSRINYSNNGYNILGQVIEKVSGLPWDEYLQRRIFSPLGMTSTGYDKTAELAGRATGYLSGKDGAYTPITVQDARGAYAGGGLYSTLEDMIRWEQGLASGKVLRKQTLELAWTRGLLNDGRRTVYGLGWMARDHRGLRQVGHGGDITGFNTYFARYPETGFTFIALSNTGMRPPGPVPDAATVVQKIAEIFLSDRMQPPQSRSSVHVESAVLGSYPGRYKLDAPEIIVRNMGSEIVIIRAGAGLIAEANGMKLPLSAISPTQFQAPGSPAELTFVCGGLAQCPKLVVTLMGLREFEARRVE